MTMVQIILLSLTACIVFNILFVYVIDFNENILSYYNEKTENVLWLIKKILLMFFPCV